MPGPGNPRDAVIYVRVSTAEQAAEGDSLDAQIAKLRAYCVMRGLNPVAELVEPGVSASKALATRPEGRKLVALVKARAVSAVVVWSLDRAFRRTHECLATVEAWTKRGVGLHIFTFGGATLDTSTAVGTMFLTMLAGFGEFERRTTGERTSLAMRHKRSRAEYIGGEPRYGWRVEGHDPAVKGSGRLVLEPDEQRVIARARELHEAGQGSRRIATALTSEGLTSRSGKPFAPVQVQRMWAD